MAETVKGRLPRQVGKRMAAEELELKQGRELGFRRARGAACAIVRERRGSIAGEVKVDNDAMRNQTDIIKEM